MANLFKVKTKADIPNTPTLVYTAGSDVVSAVVLGMILANKNNSNDITASVYLESNTADVEVNENIILLNNVSIPKNVTLEVFSGQKLNLQTNDRIKVSANITNSLDFALSIMEIT